MTIGIIDYGMGNLGSVSNACRFLSLPARIVASPGELAACDALILPGVGAFGDCMKHLTEHGFTGPIKAWIADDRPFLGICLGLQVLFTASEESPGVAGLSLYPGTVRRFQLEASYKIPQIGWNRVRQARGYEALFTGIPDGAHFYFVHSYFVDTEDAALVAGQTEYGITYTSAIARGKVMAVQFHPEKSQQVGLTLLRNFAGMAQVRNVAA